MLRLETEKYILRPLSPEDAGERYLQWLHDPDIVRTLDVDGASQTIDSLREYIACHDSVDRILFGIFTQEGLFIGTHSFRHYPKHRMATVGVMIGDRHYWGKGVPLETRECLLRWAFDDLNCNKVEAGCYSINLPSIYNFQRQKWKNEGVRKAHRIVDGKFVDVLLFGMTRDDWYASR